jgi:serralysin
VKPFADLATVVAQLTGGENNPRFDHHDITFSFPTTLSPDYDEDTFSPLTSAQQAAARQALAAIADVSGLTFTEVSGNASDLRFHNLSRLNGANGESFAMHPSATASAGVFFSPTNINYHDLLNPDIGGGHGFVTYMHEIAHTLGLRHAGNYNGGSPTYENDALFVQDTEQWTVMSYFGAMDAGADFVDADGNLRFPQTLMLYDIAAIQSLYGANTTTRTGDTIYGFHSTAGGFYDFASNPSPVVCIYDAGGIDTLDFSGFTDKTLIDLREGNFSDTASMTRNVSIAFGTVIENAVGGQAADRIVGNDVANALKGGKGGDRLDGGLGKDKLQGGAGRDKFVFSVTPGAADADKIVGFVAADDTILLERSLFRGIGKTDGIALKDSRFHASKSGQAHDHSDRITYDTTDGKLYWDRDGSGTAHDRELFATLKGHPSVDAADFLIV